MRKPRCTRQHWENRSKDLPLKIVLPNKKRFVSLQREITKKFVTKKCVIWKNPFKFGIIVEEQLGLNIPHQLAARMSD